MGTMRRVITQQADA